MSTKYSYWIHSGKYSLLHKVFVLLSGVISFMLLARALQPDALGIWGLFLIISSIVETLRNSLIRNGYVLFINTKEPQDHPGIEYAAIFTNIVYSFLFILLFLVFGSFLERVFNAEGLAVLLHYYCLTLLLLLPFSYLEIFLISRADFKAVFWMYFSRNGLMLAGIVAAYFSGWALSFLFLALLYGAGALAGLLSGMAGYNKYNKALIKKNSAILPQFIGFGKFVFANNLFSLLFRSTDSFMSSSLISAAASAFYSTCTRITNLVDMPSQVFADIMFPKAAQIMKNNDRQGIKLIYEKTVAATLTFTLPAITFIFIFPKELLVILAGREYIQAAPILQVMVFYGLFLPFIKQFGNVTDVLGVPKINSILMAVFAVFNICMNLVGIHYFGLYGSAYATMTSYFLLFICTQIILFKLLNVSQRSVFKNVFLFYGEYARLIKGFSGQFITNRIRNGFRSGQTP